VSTQDPYLLEKCKGNTCSEELAQVLGGKLAEGLEYMLFDFFARMFRVARSEWDDGGRKIGVVHRVVHGNCDFELGVVVDRDACNASPHWLENKSLLWMISTKYQ
jgi:hypothetical protein